MLDDLIRACALCPLYRTRRQAVPGEGPVPCRVMIVGEAPGEEEDRTGRPFVGRAGKLLDRVLADVGIDRSRCYVTNAVRCRPPGNRTPNAEELSTCWTWMEQTIAELDPDFIIALGSTALQLFDPTRRIRRDHGQPFWWQARRILPTYHPAAVLRDPSLEDIFRTDMAVFALILQDATEAWHRPLRTFARMGLVLRWRSPKLGETVALCSSEREAEIAWDAGLTPYTADELEAIALLNGDIQVLHEAKKSLRGTIVRQGDAPGATLDVVARKIGTS